MSIIQMARSHEVHRTRFARATTRSEAAVVAVDRAGIIIAWGPGAKRLLGREADEAVGSDIRMLLPGDSTMESAALWRVLAGESTEGVAAECAGPRGERIPVTLSATPLCSPFGEVIGAIVVFSGPGEGPRRAEADPEPVPRLVLDAALDAYVAIDGDGRVQDWNPAAETLFGWPASEAVGRPMAELIIPERLRTAHLRGLGRFLAGGEAPLIGRRIGVPAVDRAGTEFPVEVSIAPVQVGDEWRFVAFIRELPEDARVHDPAELGHWDWDVTTNSLTLSDALCRICGVGGFHGGLEGFVAAVHPEDRDAVEGAVRDAVARGDCAEHEFRLMRSGGEARFVECRASILRDHSGRAVRMLGTARDVTDRVHDDARRRRLAALVDSAPDAILSMGGDGRITSWNTGAERLFGLPAADAVGHDLAMLVPARRAGEERSLLGRLFAGEAITDLETEWVARDGRTIDVSLTMAPVVDDGGHVREASAIVRDIGARKRAEAEAGRYARDLDALAREDPLTGLLDQREFHAVLERELGACERAGEPLSIVILDIDALREVNAEHGRSAGDHVLRDLAAVVRGCSAPHQLACRIGGDEMAIICPGSAAGPALSLAGRIKRAWSRERPDVGLSAGSATSPDEAAGKDALLRHAGEALRWDKPDAGDAPVPAETLDVLQEGAHGDTAERVVALLRRHLGMEVAYLSEFVGDEQIVRIVDAGDARPDVEAGTVVALSESYCRRMVDGEIANVVPDTSADPVTSELRITSDATIGSYVGVPVRLSDGQLYGTLCCAGRHPDQELDDSAGHFVRVCARLIADLLEHHELEATNRRLSSESTAVRALLSALDARDHYTGSHSEAVVELASDVARRLDLPADEAAGVEQVALLHDIGKIGIPDEILQKRGPLSEAEWHVMRGHPVIGETIVASITSLAHLAPAVRAEHERWDGGGYPDGLAGEDVPPASRIILACDAYHAMTSDRPYRKAMSPVTAQSELRANAGSQFDPQVVDALLAAVERSG